jgi:hypothetical protein
MKNTHLKTSILLLIAFFLVWNPEIFSYSLTPVFEVSFIAKAYIALLYYLSTVGIYSDPLTILTSSIVPFVISAFVVRNVVEGGRTPSDNPKHLFGFVKYDYVGLINALLVIFALGIILLSLYSLVYFLTVSENIFR